jgi:hypothetical protein
VAAAGAGGMDEAPGGVGGAKEVASGARRCWGPHRRGGKARVSLAHCADSQFSCGMGRANSARPAALAGVKERHRDLGFHGIGNMDL